MFGLGIQEAIMGIIIGIFILVIPLAIFVLWIWALIDLLKSEFTGYNKLIWLLVLIFLPLLGLILYYFIGRKQKIK
ncbi:PLDc N-terminal domain-containing protein [Caldisericum sp.]|uniref:PLDc N-terminal domain-containing protein n=1 Tax=Caldisericum sp. TaxID=2499687 RepID=UPI003D13FF79